MSRRKEYIKVNGIKTNYTTIFLVPMLEYSQEFFPKEFISAYIDDKRIVLIFENTESKGLNETIEDLKLHSEYISMDYDDDGKEVVIFMGIHRDFEVDFNLFKVGKYSKFSNGFKEILLDTHGRMTGNGKKIQMIDVLHPDHLAKKFWADKLGISVNDLPSGETMSIMDIGLEEYNKVDKLYKQTIGE